METIAQFLPAGADACWLTSPVNRFYFTGFPSSFGVLVLTQKRKVFATDSRYAEAARLCLCGKGFEVKEGKPRELYRELAELLKRDGVRRVALEDGYLTYAAYLAAQDMLAGFETVPLGDSVEKLREVKSAEEIDWIAAAEEIGSQAFLQTIPCIKPGVSEKDVAAELEYRMKKLGADGTSFETIVAFGANTSKPHAVPTDRKAELGDSVLMDFGAKYCGYCGDMTRTVYLGNPDPELKKIYGTVYDAQGAALEQIHAGLDCREADAFARTVIERAGYGERFGHGLGHGVGVEIHEKPTVSSLGEGKLPVGAVISVEPGIYLTGIGGVRIEDLVVVEENGVRNLTTAPKEFIIL